MNQMVENARVLRDRLATAHVGRHPTRSFGDALGPLVNPLETNWART